MKKMMKNVRKIIVISNAFFITSVVPAFAWVPFNSNRTMLKIIELVMHMFENIGVIMMAVGIGLLILAFKNEDAESKTKAIYVMVVAAFLLMIGIVWKFLNITGFTVYERA